MKGVLDSNPNLLLSACLKVNINGTGSQIKVQKMSGLQEASSIEMNGDKVGGKMLPEFGGLWVLSMFFFFCPLDSRCYADGLKI